MSTFSEKIREARKAAGYTQNETADALGISMFAYLALDRGERLPTTEELNALCKLFSLDYKALEETAAVVHIPVYLDEGATLPTKAHASDAGYDLYAKQPGYIPARGSEVFDTGVHVVLPTGYCAVAMNRSGMNFKHSVVTGEGLIDAGYVGSVGVKLYNHSDNPYYVNAGDRISQLLILPCPVTELTQIDALPHTDRGLNGFGSSGK